MWFKATDAEAMTVKILTTVMLTVLVGALAGVVFIYSGPFEAAADQPHKGLVFLLAQAARERSITVRRRDITVPDLMDPKAIAAGASEYAEMCTDCHLAPGMEDNEMRSVPLSAQPRRPPPKRDGRSAYGERLRGTSVLDRQTWDQDDGDAGVGKTHDDAAIWTIVAFLQRLPTLTPEQYNEMTKESEPIHEETGHGSIHGAHDMQLDQKKTSADENGSDGPDHHH